jgi:hypothetical protein
MPQWGSAMAAGHETASTLANPKGYPWFDPSRARSLLREMSTSPGRLRAVGVALAVGLLVLGAVAIATLRDRQAAAVAVADVAEPSLEQAANLYVKLSDGDATASRAFATGGIEPADQRDTYQGDLDDATAELTALSETAEQTQAVRDDLQIISAHLARYTGSVETARSNNRQGYPVGAAYLRAASDDLRRTVLPAVLDIYKAEADRLKRAYDAGTSPLALWTLLIVGGLLLALFVRAQIWLARRTHRVVNLALLAATLVAVGATLLPSVLLAQRTANLNEARRDGSDALIVLSSTRILAMRMRADEILELVGRGTNRDAYVNDFNDVKARLQGADNRGGLLALAPDSLRTKLAGYLVARNQVVLRESEVKLQEATDVATSNMIAAPATASETQLFDALIGEIDKQVKASRTRFSGNIRVAQADLGTTYGVIAIGVLAGAALVTTGVHQRLKEYQ